MFILLSVVTFGIENGRCRVINIYFTNKCILLSLYLESKISNARINVTLRRVLCNHCCSTKTIGILYRECLWSFTQHAMRISQIVVCGLPRCATIFHIISITARFSKSKKKVTEDKACVLISSTTFVWKISNYKKNWARYDKNVYWSSCKVPFILVRF